MNSFLASRVQTRAGTILNPNSTRLCMLLLLLFTAVSAAGNEDRVLYDFGPAFNLDGVGKSDVDVRLNAVGSARVMQIKTGTTQSWPGVTLSAPEGHWDLSAFGHVELRVRNAGDNRVTVNCRVDNPGADGKEHCVTDGIDVEPGAIQTLRVALRRVSDDTLGGKLFGMRGYPVKTNGDNTIDPAKVTQLLVFVNKPSVSHTFEVSDIRATGKWVKPTAWTSDATPYFPLIDTFGQYRHKDWPAKTHTLEELHARKDAEATQLARDRGPEGWNQYGSWAAGPQLKATGHFRVEKHQGKWWLVDPEGKLFWSHGIDCVRMLDYTIVEEREDWFEDLPARRIEFREFTMPRSNALKGHFAGRSMRSFSFAGANLKRKYGDNWKQVVPVVIHQRLRQWGLNTIGNWSDDGVRLLRRTPYTDTISSRGAPDIDGSEGYWGKFPDVFDPAFERALRRSMADRTNDPWCIGFFSDNELSWGDDVSLALAALRSPKGQAAKQAFVADLRAKYERVSNLNQAWGTEHVSWEALLASRASPDVKKSRVDLKAFYTRTAERYFATVRGVIRETAPRQLYLGCRFASVNDLAANAAGKYCDVVSYNRYQRSVADFKFPGEDKPLMIGEFHFGALDRGMFHTGLTPVANQAARAQAYQEYVNGALRHPQFVGTHWFQYQDQPTTGRVYDEENYQIGFVDIADTPHAETVAASRRIATQLYEKRLAK